jgi:hypothetical protein
LPLVSEGFSCGVFCRNAPSQGKMEWVMLGLLHITWAGAKTYYVQDQSAKLTWEPLHNSVRACGHKPSSQFCCPFRDLGLPFCALPNFSQAQWGLLACSSKRSCLRSQLKRTP